MDACTAMWRDVAVTRFIGGKPSSPQQSWARLLGYLGHWSVLNFGYWVIEEKASGAFAGEIGFADFKRDIAASMKDVPEFGYALASRVHRKGYATEAARAAIAWSDRHLPAPRTVCMIDADNLASLRIAEKCGYEAFDRAPFDGRPTIFFARNRQPTTL